jgi:hypothetical protein
LRSGRPEGVEQGLVGAWRQSRDVLYAVRPDELDAATRWMAQVPARLDAITRIAEARYKRQED